MTAMFVSAVSLQAQTATASLRGRVTDPSGGVLAQALVTITQTETGRTRAILTNRRGFYAAPALIAGPYRLEVEVDGFKKLREEVSNLSSAKMRSTM